MTATSFEQFLAESPATMAEDIDLPPPLNDVEGRGTVSRLLALSFLTSQALPPTFGPVSAAPATAAGIELWHDTDRGLIAIRSAGSGVPVPVAYGGGASSARIDEHLVVDLADSGMLAVPCEAGGFLVLRAGAGELSVRLHGPVDALSLAPWAPDVHAWLALATPQWLRDELDAVLRRDSTWSRLRAAGLFARHAGRLNVVRRDNGAVSVVASSPRPWLAWAVALSAPARDEIAAGLASQSRSLGLRLEALQASYAPERASWRQDLGSLRRDRELMEGVGLLLRIAGGGEQVSLAFQPLDRLAVVATALLDDESDDFGDPLLRSVGQGDPGAWWGV